jgi:hypothetical protein
MSTQIHSGGLTTKDPDAIELFTMDWDQENLPTGVGISSSSWTVTGPDTDLTTDQPSVLSGSRRTQVRLSGGTTGKTYTVTNQIVTNTSPSETKDRSFRVLIEQE